MMLGGFYVQEPISDDEHALYDVFPALLSAVRRAAESLVDQDPAPLRQIVRLFEVQPEPLFKRLALHIIARRPTADPELASSYLSNPALIEASWCAHEYAQLALAWFPSMPADGNGPPNSKIERAGSQSPEINITISNSFSEY